MGTVSFTVSLQRIDIGVCNDTATDIHAINLWVDILELARLVVYALAPIAGLLLIEHLQSSCIGKHLAKIRSTSLELSFEVRKNQAPQPRIETLKCVAALFCVVSLTTQGVEVCEEAVVTCQETGIAIIVCNIPQQAVPCTSNHIFYTLVHQCKIVSEDVICQQEVHRKIMGNLRLKLLTLPSREVSASHISASRYTIAYPSQQTSYAVLLCNSGHRSLFLLCLCRSPIHILGEVKLEGVIKPCIKFSFHLGRCRTEELELVKRIGVVQELKGNGTLPIDSGTISRFNRVHSGQIRPIALIVVQVVLTVVGAFAIYSLCREHIDRVSVDSTADIAIYLLRRCKKPEFFEYIVEELCSTGVMCH